ncbi:hypothetical protein [Alkanindiges hydrocarboniclasticus]|nr:hypothetical protein [Alkanindiges hydrocarboniclasticus]
MPAQHLLFFMSYICWLFFIGRSTVAHLNISSLNWLYIDANDMQRKKNRYFIEAMVTSLVIAVISFGMFDS